MNNYLFPLSDIASRREIDKGRVREENGRVRRKTLKVTEERMDKNVMIRKMDVRREKQRSVEDSDWVTDSDRERERKIESNLNEKCLYPLKSITKALLQHHAVLVN